MTFVPALDEISTHGETREEALDQTRDMIAGYLEAAAQEGIPVPSGSPAAELVELGVPVE